MKISDDSQVLVGNFTKKPAPAKMKFGQLLEQYWKTFPFKEQPWRKGKFQNVRRHSLSIQPIEVNKITRSDVEKMNKGKDKKAADNIFTSLTAILRFICDGETRLYKMGDREAAANGKIPIKIQPIEMTLEQALQMMSSAKSVYGDIIENIMVDLATLPKGKPYPFEPRGNIDEKSMVAMRSAIQQNFVKHKRSFTIRRVKDKNIFIIFHLSDISDKHTKQQKERTK